MAATYEFTVRGKTPMLMHRDNIQGTDEIRKWQQDPENKKLSTKGDDRSPAWLWQIYLHTSNGKVVLPSNSLMSCLRKAGTMIEVPGAKRGKTFKDATQYGIMPHEETYDLVVAGGPVETGPIAELWGDMDFDKQVAAAQAQRFDLHLIRAVIGQSKHVRVRPIFADWSFKGAFEVTEPAITDEIMAKILGYAGDRCGLGDWRPSSKTPGPFGRFDVSLKRLG